MTHHIGRGWWRSAALYQIYVRSFADSDGDGVGDLAGIRSRLPVPARARRRRALADSVLPLAGRRPRLRRLGLRRRRPAVRDARRLRRARRGRARARAAHLVDIVPNHTSTEHAWFRNAIADPSTDRVRYFFRLEGRRPPNSWPSTFGGSAWTFDERRASTTSTSSRPSSPTSTGTTRPSSRTSRRSSASGSTAASTASGSTSRTRSSRIRSLRDDARAVPAHAARRLAARARPAGAAPASTARWRRLVDEYPGDRMSSARSCSPTRRTSRATSVPTSCTSRFNFTLLLRGLGRRGAPRGDRATLAALGASAPPRPGCFENHDVTRLPTRYGGASAGGGEPARRRCSCSRCPGRRSSTRARSSASRRSTCPMTAPGSGLLPHERRAAGRDGCRVPLPWKGEPPAFGFTTGTPWLPIPRTGRADRGGAGARPDLDALALPLRRSRSGRATTLRLAGEPAGSLAFDRGDIVCVVNVDAPELELPEGELLLASEPGDHDEPAPDTAAWVGRQSSDRQERHEDIAGIWAFGNMATRFNPAGYKPELAGTSDRAEGAHRGRGPRRPDRRLRVPLPAGALAGEPRRGARGARRPRRSTASRAASTSTRASRRAASARPTTRRAREALRLTREAIDLAGEIGAQMIIWPGIEGYNYPFQTPYERVVGAVRRRRRRGCAQHAKSRGVTVFLEHKNSEPAMKILMRNIGMTLHVIHTLRRQGIDNVSVNMDWQHLLMNGESLAEYAALLARRGPARAPARERRLGHVRRRQHGRDDPVHGDARARGRAAARRLRRQRRAARLRPLPVHRGRGRAR